MAGVSDFGRAFPVTLVIDRSAQAKLTDALRAGLADLEAAEQGGAHDA